MSRFNNKQKTLKCDKNISTILEFAMMSRLHDFVLAKLRGAVYFTFVESHTVYITNMCSKFS